jgi:uncharacterized protein
VQSVMRSLMQKAPVITKIREDVAGLDEERVREALDAVSALARGDGRPRDPYRLFLNTLEKPAARRTRANSTVLRGLERMRD